MSKCLLVLSTDKTLSVERMESMGRLLSPVAKRLGFELVIAGDGMVVSVHHDLSPLVDAMNKQAESVRELVDSNRALIAAMADERIECDDDATAVTYLDDHLG